MVQIFYRILFELIVFLLFKLNCLQYISTNFYFLLALENDKMYIKEISHQNSTGSFV